MKKNYDEELEKSNRTSTLLQNLFDIYSDLDEDMKDKLRTEIFMFFAEHTKELQADEWEIAGCLFEEISFINLMSYFPEHKDLKLELLERLNIILQLNNNTNKNIRR